MSVRAPGARVRAAGRVRVRQLAVAALTMLLASGCSTANFGTPRTFRLAYVPPMPAATAPLPAVVRVMPFGIAATYDRESFLFRSGPYDVGVDYYNRWLANPATMITDLVARDLAASRSVRGVLQMPSALPADYELSGQIETIEERDENDACAAHLRVRMLVIGIRGGRHVAAQQSLVADEPCTRGDPESYAAAMSRAAERISTDMRSALMNAIIADAPAR